MESSPEMVESCRSKGAATEAAIVSGLAPGSEAETWMVGKSTLGRAATGSNRYPKTPPTMIEIISRLVMTGRRIQSSARVTTPAP
jgi:hypothetical protein